MLKGNEVLCLQSCDVFNVFKRPVMPCFELLEILSLAGNTGKV
jgi:hypothetical protein